MATAWILAQASTWCPSRAQSRRSGPQQHPVRGQTPQRRTACRLDALADQVRAHRSPPPELLGVETPPPLGSLHPPRSQVAGTDHVGQEHTVEEATLTEPISDPIVVLPGKGQVTEHLGLGATSAQHPYTFARCMSTLDHLTGRRFGCNIVTGHLESVARNMEAHNWSMTSMHAALTPAGFQGLPARTRTGCIGASRRPPGAPTESP